MQRHPSITVYEDCNTRTPETQIERGEKNKIKTETENTKGRNIYLEIWRGTFIPENIKILGIEGEYQKYDKTNSRSLMLSEHSSA